MHCCLCYSFDRSLAGSRPFLVSSCVFSKSLDSLSLPLLFFFFRWANRLTRPRHSPTTAQLTSAVAPALQALSHSLSLPSLSCSGAALRNRQFGGHLPSQSPPQRERVTQPTQRCCIHSLPGVKVAIPLPPRRQAVTSSRRLASAPKPPGHAAKSHISLVAVINTKHAACRCPAASQRPAPQPVPAYSISMIPGPDSTLAASL